MSTGTTFINYKDVELRIEYETTPYRPAVYYLSNGDPGYPEEGGDFDVYEVLVGDQNIISLLSGADMEEITQRAIRSVENDREEY